MEAAAGVEGGVSVSGWAIDPDTRAPISVHVYVGDAGTALTAGSARSDVGAVYPVYGPEHGYSAVLSADPGTYNVCAYGINVGVGTNVQLGCKSVTVPAVVDRGRPPVGAFEGLSAAGSTVTASGWAIDPDTARPLQVRLEARGGTTLVSADRARNAGGAGSAARSGGAKCGRKLRSWGRRYH